jgi:long-chain acyl-CoA synthetase
MHLDFTRLCDILDYQHHRFPSSKAVVERLPDGTWRYWSSEQLMRGREALSAGLLQLGVHHGQRFGLMVHCGSPQWLIADAALLQIGVVPVPIHATARPDEIAHIVADAELTGCFVSNQAMFDRLQTAGASLRHTISFDAVKGDAKSWESVVCEPDQHDLDKIKYLRDGIQPTDTALMMYTSGTTGLPRGVVLTHENIVSNIKSVLAIIPVDSTMRVLSFLPVSHIFEKTVNYLYQTAGTSVWFADSIERLPLILKEVKPHFFTAVPRILERSYERMIERRGTLNRLSRNILDWAINLGERYPYAGGRAMPLDYRLKRLVADWLVFRHWRRAMGGKVEYIAVGAASLQPRLGRLFSAAGIDVREGYGLTETSPVVAFNRFEPGGVHFGTVGIPAPGVEVRIDDPDDNGEGEIQVRGLNVMKEYHNQPAATAEKFTTDGWFRTGDKGRFEHKRFLRVTGRLSDIFKTSSGKFVAPAFVEQQLSTLQIVSQCIATGLNQPNVGVLIVPNFDALEQWCRDHKVHWTAPEYMVINPKVEQLFRQEIQELNKTLLGQAERIGRFRLLVEAWTVDNGLLTPSLKVKRPMVMERFANEIGSMLKV